MPEKRSPPYSRKRHTPDRECHPSRGPDSLPSREMPSDTSSLAVHSPRPKWGPQSQPRLRRRHRRNLLFPLFPIQGPELAIRIFDLKERSAQSSLNEAIIQKIQQELSDGKEVVAVGKLPCGDVRLFLVSEYQSSRTAG